MGRVVVDTVAGPERVYHTRVVISPNVNRLFGGYSQAGRWQVARSRRRHPAIYQAENVTRSGNHVGRGGRTVDPRRNPGNVESLGYVRWGDAESASKVLRPLLVEGAALVDVFRRECRGGDRGD